MPHIHPLCNDHTHQKKGGSHLSDGPLLAQRVKNNSGILIGCHRVSLSPGVFVALGLHWLGSNLGRNTPNLTTPQHSPAASLGWDPTVGLPFTAVSGSDDWHSANSYQHRPNNSGRALMNVFVMYDLHNIGKPQCGDLPQCLCPTWYSQYFSLLCCSQSCIWGCWRYHHCYYYYYFFFLQTLVIKSQPILVASGLEFCPVNSNSWSDFTRLHLSSVSK